MAVWRTHPKFSQAPRLVGWSRRQKSSFGQEFPIKVINALDVPLFGVIYGYLALSNSELLFRSPFLLVTGLGSVALSRLSVG
jgi:hypothetical protein